MKPTDSLLDFEEWTHPVTNLRCVEVFLRYKPNRKISVAWCTEEYAETGKPLYRVYSSENDKEFCPPSDDFEQIKGEIHKYERVFIENEIAYQLKYGSHHKPRMLTNRLRELNGQQITEDTEIKNRNQECKRLRNGKGESNSHTR